MPHHLSKSRFVAGHQCHRLLWWKVHEPDAEELQPDIVLQDLFDQGAQVGALARERWPGGVLIGAGLPHNAYSERVAATRAAVDGGASAIFEGAFVADGTFVAVDVLVRDGAQDAWRLIEVKSSSSQKDEHLIDAGVQAHVLARSGLDVRAIEIMHLNKEFRHPDTGDLFERTDVTDQVGPLLPTIPGQIEAQLAMLDGPVPDVPIGINCHEPRTCPFHDRCWPQDADHISKLYNVGPKKCADYMAQGVHRIGDIPPKKKLPAAAQRQIRSLRDDCLVVEPTLRDSLAPFSGKLGFLDFETVSRAIPVWAGMKPWEQTAAQFSYHEAGDATYSHRQYLAEGPQDCRPEIAERLVAATRGAERVVTYSAFEKTRIRALQQCVPELKDELLELEGKLVDLLPVVRENVYHPGFHGGFGLKHVLPALVPGLTYSDLVIVDGMVASVEIARLLFVSGRIPPAEQARVRKDLLDYCERDTWALVKLLERLRELAGVPPGGYTRLRLV